MIEITDSTERCFALWFGRCSIRTDNTQDDCTPRCPFYKPQGCEDWIRREVNETIWLIPPEEYAKYAEQVKASGK